MSYVLKALKELNYITESKQDQEKFKQWLTQELTKNKIPTTQSGVTTKVDQLYNDFINNKYSFKSPQNDIYYWMKQPIDTFISFIDNLNNQTIQKQQLKALEDKGSKLLYKDANWRIYEITNYEASAKYGKGTKWCISGSKYWNNGEHGAEHFNRYKNYEGCDFYFFINKNDEKWCLVIYTSGDFEGLYQIFNAEDIEVSSIPNAPKVEQINVNYTTTPDSELNDIITKENGIPFNDFRLVFEYTWEGSQDTECRLFNNKQDTIDFLEHEADMLNVSVGDLLGSDDDVEYLNKSNSKYYVITIPAYDEYYYIYYYADWKKLLLDADQIFGSSVYGMDWIEDAYNHPYNPLAIMFVDTYKSLVKQGIIKDTLIKKLENEVGKNMNENMLNEYRTKSVPQTITDPKIKQYFKECIDALTDLGYDLPSVQLIESMKAHSFGTTYWPETINDNIKVAINKAMFNEPEEAIKNTMYHELCHVINMYDQLHEGIVYWDDYDKLLYNKALYTKAEDSSHGNKWLRIAADVSKELNLNPPISVTNSFQLHPGVGEATKSRYKYTVVCQNCGSKINFIRQTEFVKNPNSRWRCGRCKAKNFKTIQNF